MAFWKNITSWLGGWLPFTKSTTRGERVITSWFPGWNHATSFGSWSNDRGELVQHFRGWNYIAIKSICEEIAGMCPQVAYVRDKEEIGNQRKRIIKSVVGSRRRKSVLREHGKRYLNRWQRRKALTRVQYGDEIEPVNSQHPLVKLFNNPNGPDVAWTFFYKLVMYLELTGTSYIYVIRDRIGRPVELWPLPTQWMWPVGGEERLIDHYEVRPTAGYVATDFGAGWFPGGAGMEKIDADDVIRISYPNPVNFLDGYSALQACSTWSDALSSMDSARVMQFTNGMFPGVVLELQPDTIEPDDATIAGMKERIKHAYGGVKNTGEPVMLSPGVMLKPFTWNPEQMMYHESGDQLKSWILATYKVGESIAGLAEQTNFASMVASKANFYQNTISPRCILIGQVLTEKLAKPLDESLLVYYDDPTPNDPAHELQKNQTMVSSGAKTINEWRAEEGLEPFEFGGDDPIMSMAVSPVPWATGEDADDIRMPAMFDIQNEQQQGGGDPMGGLSAMMGGGGEQPDAEPPAEVGEADQSEPTALGEGPSANGNIKPKPPSENRLRGLLGRNGKPRV